MPTKNCLNPTGTRIAPNATRARQSGAAPNCRVLVVDDDELACARVALLLKSCAFEVELASCGDDALRIMDAARCDIVVTDWQMPTMDGLSLCRNLRDRERDEHAYVLIHTVRDSPQDVLTGLAAGADDYLVKGAPTNLLVRLEVARRVASRGKRLDCADRGR